MGLMDQTVRVAAFRRPFPVRAPQWRRITIHQRGGHDPSTHTRLFGVEQIEQQRQPGTSVRAGKEAAICWRNAGARARRTRREARGEAGTGGVAGGEVIVERGQ